MDDSWANIRAGRSGVSRIEGFEMPEGTVNIAGQVKGFDPTEYMDKRTVRKTDRFAHLSVAAATQAVADADLDVRADAARIGCSIGTGVGGLKTQEIAHAKLFEAGPDRLSPFWVTALIANMGAAEVSMALGHARPAHDGMHGLCRIRHVDRQCHHVHPGGHGRRDAGRRRRGPDRAARAGWVRHDAGAVAAAGRSRRVRAAHSTPVVTASSSPREPP